METPCDCIHETQMAIVVLGVPALKCQGCGKLHFYKEIKKEEEIGCGVMLAAVASLVIAAAFTGWVVAQWMP